MTAAPRVLTINGGSSSIKFALFEAPGLRRAFTGRIERIGSAGTLLRVEGSDPRDHFSRPVAGAGGAPCADQRAAIAALMDWLSERIGGEPPSAVGHRIVHGGPEYSEAQIVSPPLLESLRRLTPIDPEHLPEEILLIEAFQSRFAHLPQIACFDTAFHHDLPRIAQLLPIPRRFQAQGLRRYGFHGLSYAYLMEELPRIAGSEAARGRVILAHLGNGASLAALHEGRVLDTSMGFTPAAGVMMGTRTGDLDPGIAGYLARTERMDPQQFNDMVNFQSGLLGVSETHADMQALLALQSADPRAADAVELFCRQIKKCIGAFAAVLGGLDTLVFAGGIGEHAAEVRSRICAGLGFLGVEICAERNAAHAPVISAPHSSAAVRVMRTDEELMIARSVFRLLRSAHSG